MKLIGAQQLPVVLLQALNRLKLQADKRCHYLSVDAIILEQGCPEELHRM